ncbi:MAG: pyrroloquinoline quinone-dependent dehydrogenase, partial [Acidobacteria bacterium]|nr:pyrroloquinoline quinone-dependent dehydrogenase [Acidobacteriota bacterium]
MTQTRLCAAVLLVLLAGAAGCGGGPIAPAAGDAAPQAGGDWPLYRGDPAGTGYSPLAQVNPANVAGLAQAWTYSLRAADDDDTTSPRSQITPIVVDGVMYLPAADRVIALDPVSGQEHWRHVPGAAGAPSRRGVAWWRGADGLPPRILF